MSSTLKPTQPGISKLANASAGGLSLNLTKFIVTEKTGFEPGDVLLGTPAYEGNIISIESVNSGVVKFTCEIPAGIPENNVVWRLGEVMLYHEDGTPFAHGTLDPVYEKRAELGLRIHAYIAQSELGDVINASVATVNSIPSYPHVKNLPNAINLSENAFSLLDGKYNVDGSNSPVIATRYGPGGALWGFEGYTRVYTGVLSSIESQSKIKFSSPLSFVTNEVAIFHVTTGPAAGQSRRLRYDGSWWVELDTKPFEGLTSSSRVAVWRNPVSVIESLQKSLIQSLNEGVRWASTTEYNALARTLNEVSGTPTGVPPNNKGYGQEDLAVLTSTALPTQQHWNALFERTKLLARYQGVTIPELANTDFLYQQSSTSGVVVMSETYKDLITATGVVETNFNKVKPTNLVTEVPQTGTVSRTTEWSNNVTHELQFIFASTNAMKAYFNSGGKIVLFSSLVDGVDAHENDWKNFLASLGSIDIRASTTAGSLANQVTTNGGFYSITTSYVDLFKHVYAGTTGHPMEYTLKAKLENSGKTIRVVAKLRETVAPYSTGASTNTGTLTSKCTLYKAGALLSAPTQTFPGVVSSGTL